MTRIRNRNRQSVPDITADRLRDLYRYDAEKGTFTRLLRSSALQAGTIAGIKTNRKGYAYIQIDNRVYLAHRLAWLYVNGDWPKAEIDHINGDKSDNRIENLRDVSKATNMQNLKGPRRDNKSSGLLGVTLHKKVNKFSAQIVVEGKLRHLGLFADPQDAHAAYLDAKRKLHAGCTI